jgi:hypothetical protein
MPHWIDGKSYELDVDLTDMLVLRTCEDLDDFTDVYGSELGCADYFRNKFRVIDWKQVAREFAGIEIAPYQWDRRHTLSWYYGWDCASGCVWHPRAVKGVREVTREDIGRYCHGA